ncbi:hypothetical protein PoB_005043600 [Plakobranchus ocellatus]|uniref:Malectin-like domain-containing protein n=1 Tax=Plakobranchus ocellatus TaxID=259542 RepID=A0AAV4BTX1_9GAST|nr:hypothetical protein PoB_005043600 [Plakobranchus ocellatus]
MDSFSAKSIFRVLMVFSFALIQFCEAVAPLSGWSFNVLWIKRNRLLVTNKYLFRAKYIKEQDANIRIAYCGKATTPCREPQYEKHGNDGSWLASFIWNAKDEGEFYLHFSFVKGENLRSMRLSLKTIGGSSSIETVHMFFLDALNVITFPADEMVYTPGEDAILGAHLEDPYRRPYRMQSMFKRIDAFWVGSFYDSTANLILPFWNNFRIHSRMVSFLKYKSFTIPLSERLLSGYIRLGNMAILKSPIISDIMMDTYVVLRAENQTGPFPEGLIRIVPASRCQ